MGKPDDTEEKEVINDAASRIYMHVVTNTPYYGPLVNTPGYYLWNVNYRPANFVMMSSDKDEPDTDLWGVLDRIAEDGGRAADIGSYIAEISSLSYYNSLFHVNIEKGTLARTKSAITGTPARTLAQAKEMAQVGKNFSNVMGRINVGVVLYQTGRDVATGNVNMGTIERGALCAVGFIPGVGWVIAGVYLIADIIVEQTTGQGISEHADDWWENKMLELAYKWKTFEKACMSMMIPAFPAF